MFVQSHAISDVAASASPVLKIICRIGMRATKEKIFNIIERMLNITDAIRYFLYGGTKRLRKFINSFIF
jgi:hypothetical protein